MTSCPPRLSDLRNHALPVVENDKWGSHPRRDRRRRADPRAKIDLRYSVYLPRLIEMTPDETTYE